MGRRVWPRSTLIDAEGWFICDKCAKRENLCRCSDRSKPSMQKKIADEGKSGDTRLSYNALLRAKLGLTEREYNVRDYD